MHCKNMDEQQQPEIFRIQLTRRDSGLSWGFRLQGGVDFNTPLSVQVVSTNPLFMLTVILECFSFYVKLV